MPKRGRPLTAPANARDHWLRVRLTESERQAFERAAAKSGQRLSEYVRDRLGTEGAPLEAAPHAATLVRALDDAAREAARIGNNLNQIAHQLNATGRIRSVPDLEHALTLIRQVGERHLRALEKVLSGRRLE